MKKVIKCTLNSADSCADDELYFTVNDMIYLLNSIAQLPQLQGYEIYATEIDNSVLLSIGDYIYELKT